MKKFYKMSGILICEWEAFEHSILTGKHGVIYTKEQWKNRRLGRTKLQDFERQGLIMVLHKLRTEEARKEENEQKAIEIAKSITHKTQQPC